MKSLVLGIMIASVSISFAQNDDAPTHQLKKRFAAKKMMAVEHVAADVSERNSAANNSDFDVLSRKDVKSSITSGVIRMERGTPFIVLNTNRTERKLMPMNFPKKMAVDGQEIQFSYIVTDAKFPKNSGQVTVVSLYDVSISPKK